VAQTYRRYVGSMGRRRGRRTRSDRERLDLSHLLPPRSRPQRGPAWLRRLLDWLYTPVGAPADPDQLVELTRVPSRQDAQNLVQELDLQGVQAHLFGGDAEGTAPHYATMQGHRVMVRARDHHRAVDVITRGQR
jgi:hypothetical protein